MRRRRKRYVTVVLPEIVSSFGNVGLGLLQATTAMRELSNGALHMPSEEPWECLELMTPEQRNKFDQSTRFLGALLVELTTYSAHRLNTYDYLEVARAAIWDEAQNRLIGSLREFPGSAN
jgi:hypothetical protein